MQHQNVTVAVASRSLDYCDGKVVLAKGVRQLNTLTALQAR